MFINDMLSTVADSVEIVQNDFYVFRTSNPVVSQF